MSDWPGVVMQSPVICAGDQRSGSAGSAIAVRAITSSAVWPAANRAIYIPVEVQVACTAYQMGLQVVTQSGNLDVGIYDVNANRLVSSTSTAVAVAGVQVVNIADTTLTPGVYFLAMCVDNTTASFRTSTLTALVLQSVGVQQQAVGAVTLPNPATFANPASAYAPMLYVSTMQATL